MSMVQCSYLFAHTLKYPIAVLLVIVLVHCQLAPSADVVSVEVGFGSAS
jgi:hypothetical protein